MDLNKLIQARAHRILKGLERYQSLVDEDMSILAGNEPDLQEGEILIGLYRNHQASLAESIVISSVGLHVLRGKWEFVEYRSISEISIPLNQDKYKRRADRLLLRLHSGDEIEIPVLGGDERSRDAWSMLHFVLRVQKDTQKRAE